MHIRSIAVGRLRAGPEKTLIDDYLARANRAGRGQSLSFEDVIEVEDRKGGGKQAEGMLLERAIPENAVRICLDERGKMMTSPDLANMFARWRDDGRQDCAILIGGADGLSDTLRARADLSISFGKLVWPHMLVRVMLAEQLYRVTQILSGTPYHRV